jgi:cytochrome c
MMKGPRAIAAVATTFVFAVGAVHADGDPKRGEKAFEECRACHAVERGVDGVGPDLHGVFGRRAAALADFRYSPALKRSGITWTPQTLDDYIADPQKVVPANRMPYAGMPDARDRADVIIYMQEVFK